MSTVHLITFWHFLLDTKLYLAGYWHAKSSYKNRCHTVYDSKLKGKRFTKDLHANKYVYANKCTNWDSIS